MSTLSQWVGQLSVGHCDPDPRNRRMAALIISSILYGRVLGAPSLVGLVRAIPERKRKTFIVGRVHIEVGIARKGVADLEQRMWLPDPLTGTLWCSLGPNDADELLAPVIRDGKSSASDAVVFRRIGKLINQFRVGSDPKLLPGIEELRRSAREFAFGESSPVFVAYDSTELQSESLRRGDVPRLFPGEPLLQFEDLPNTKPQRVVVDAGDLIAVRQVPAWIDLLISKRNATPLRRCLSALASDTSLPQALRMMADFGVALDSRTPRHGKPLPPNKIMYIVILIAGALGLTLDSQDLAALDPKARREVYLDAINRQPVHTRRDAVQAVIEFDGYLVANSSDASPVPKSTLPWLPKDGSVDPGLITHSEYHGVLDRIEAAWPAKRGERERKMVRLLIILEFRCALRRSETSGRRIEDLLIRGFEELQLPHRAEDPLKTRNAQRRIPVGALLSVRKGQELDERQELSELQELRDWLKRRVGEGAKSRDYLFSTPDGKRIPKSLFEKLNKFLRNETRQANEGKGVHLHHLRHAAGSWLFVSLMFAGSKDIASLFPQLHETHLWFAESESLREALCGHTTPTKKVPFIVACLCGHGSFDTTALSYINIFPWLVAHELDGLESMRPDPTLVQMASGLSKTKFRRWVREGGLHSIPARLLAEQGARAAAEIQEDPESPGGYQPRLRGGTDWLTPAWRLLVRRGMGEFDQSPSDLSQSIYARADWLSRCLNDHDHARHPFEWREDKCNPTVRIPIAAPLMSGRARSGVELALLDSIQRLRVDNSQLLTDAVGLFAQHHEQDGFVLFASVSELKRADRYIEFLRSQGFEKRELELVSGDGETDSRSRRQWRLDLSETYLIIRPCPPGGNYGPKSALWIRPKATALTKRNTNAAGFRFTMAMAFIVFGSTSNTNSGVFAGPAASA